VNSEHTSNSKGRKPFWGLLCRRECLVPSWRGWVALLAVVTLTVFLTVRTVYFFLAVSAPVNGDVLVVEGWAPDYAMEHVIEEFRRHPYRALCVTGGPLEKGAPLAEYKTGAELGAATIEKLGLRTNAVHAVPATAVRKDRTFASAVTLKHWLREQGISAAKINVVSGGPHARRTRLLFEKAFGKDSQIGIISVEDQSYDAKQWWASSQGVRVVVSEILAYGYARLIFRPPKE
jgi:hypothetical protein